jgi:hypothetical protein
MIDPLLRGEKRNFVPRRSTKQTLITNNDRPNKPIHVFVAANSIDLACIVFRRESGEYANGLLPDFPRFETPLSAKNDSSTYPRGLAVDFGNSITITPQNPDDPPVSPRPILWCITTDGVLLAYHCVDWEHLQHTPGMIQRKRLPPPQKARQQQQSVTPRSSANGVVMTAKSAPISSDLGPFGDIIIHLKDAIEQVPLDSSIETDVRGPLTGYIIFRTDKARGGSRTCT